MPPSRTEGPYVWIDRSAPAGTGWLIARLEEREKALAEALAGGETLF